MNVETLGTVLLIAGIAAFLVRILTGFTLAGCLVSYVLACLGAVTGWWVQDRFFVPDQWVVLPLSGDPVAVSVIGATIGALIFAYFGGLFARPRPVPRRTRLRR